MNNNKQLKQPTTERIKTIEDAVAALGDNHPYVVAYKFMTDADEYKEPDIIAYIKLRIISEALNDGWKPKFHKKELRWAPWFILYTNDEIENMNEDERARICRFVRANDRSTAAVGLACANACYACSGVYSYDAANIIFKTSDLAKYAGTQFIEIYRDFLIAQ